MCLVLPWVSEKTKLSDGGWVWSQGVTRAFMIGWEGEVGGGGWWGRGVARLTHRVGNLSIAQVKIKLSLPLIPAEN